MMTGQIEGTREVPEGIGVATRSDIFDHQNGKSDLAHSYQEYWIVYLACAFNSKMGQGVAPVDFALTAQ